VWQPSPESSIIMAQQIRQALSFWNQCEQITMRLLPSLKATAMAKFRPWRA